MSLSALLLRASGSKPDKVVDTDLDALFRSSAIAEGKKKRKSREANDGDVKGSGSKKRAKILEEQKRREEKQKVEPSEDNDSGLDVGKEPVKDVEASDEEVDPSQLAHESVAKPAGKSSRNRKSKHVPENETADQRDRRTIFVGNLSVEVAQKRPLLKQLHRHILSHVPFAKIESTRFRSIPFQNPTSKLPTSDDEETPSKTSKTVVETSNKQARQHDRDRTATWRADQEDSEIKADDKKFLNPKQKKKIAFINREFHSSADSVNAYIVFAHPVPALARPSNVPPPPETMDPFDAARHAVEKCDGTLFMERMIRVDFASKTAKEHSGTVDGNPKLSVFVGNLDFGCKEEDLRVFFEGVVSGERGPPGDDEEDQKVKTWVTRVRIVRDKETQLGKGFAYVQFMDRECVDEILAMDEAKLKFAKRKLRVQRCKTVPGGSITSTLRPTTGDSKSPVSVKPRAPAVPISVPSIPKGDPSLGGKLEHLPKDQRKQIKSTDADRVARRLAKKARNALAKEGIKPQVKDRDRVRKTAAVKKAFIPRKKESKGRVRSEKSVTKRNVKK
ncbi:hypothetical protein PILCRDRAFT_722317 [Piloderma croceum F 1598]|uniref:Nucleolar protein 12 n=1 Tax=Piloderma croceum (strain F 1598) TaxID=765440 RepID=A0A0C3AIM7_PILCF|nr:hypothetical protein PILCRDRAFT_722317 [Piloderma croceum F 1598]